MHGSPTMAISWPAFLVTLLLKLNFHNKICSTRLPDTSTMNIVAKVGQTVLNNLQRCYCQNPNITSTQPQVNHRIGFVTNISLNHHLSRISTPSTLFLIFTPNANFAEKREPVFGDDNLTTSLLFFCQSCNMNEYYCIRD